MDNRMATAPSLISTVICTYNRCESLLVTLESLARMSVPPHLGWELIVVDNNSSDQTAKEVKSLIASGNSLPLRYVLEPVSGLSQARNRGIRESRGAVIAFLDDDVVVSPEWLAEVRRAFAQHDAECIGGRVLLHQSRPRPAWWDKTFDGAVGEFDRGAETIIDRTEETPIGIGANIFFRRTAFERCGGFRTDMGRNANQLTTGEETDMVQRLRQQGRQVMYYPQALVYHRVPAERFSKHYLRQHFFNSGKWHFLKEADDPGMVPRILSVPRWRYRLALAKLWSAFRWKIKGRPSESFFEQLQVVFFLGYFSAAQKGSKPRGMVASDTGVLAVDKRARGELYSGVDKSRNGE